MPSDKEIEAAVKAYKTAPTRVNAQMDYYMKAALEAAEKVRAKDYPTVYDKTQCECPFEDHGNIEDNICMECGLTVLKEQ